MRFHDAITNRQKNANVKQKIPWALNRSPVARGHRAADPIMTSRELVQPITSSRIILKPFDSFNGGLESTIPCRCGHRGVRPHIFLSSRIADR
jgi:hypothetical protein